MKKMKTYKTTAWLTAVCLLAGMLAMGGPSMTVYADAAWEGLGTEGDPYQISSAADLAALSAAMEVPDSEYADAWFLQTVDIDLSGFDNWIPIGSWAYAIEDKRFAGTYDGGNHTISNMTVTNAEPIGGYANAGLFGAVGEGGIIKNLKLTSVQITNDQATNARIGALTGLSWGTISCVSGEDITIAYSENAFGSLFAGGLVGANPGTVSNSYCFASIEAEGNTLYTGGLIGSNGGTLLNSYSIGTITNLGTLYHDKGGLVGQLNVGAVISSYYNQDVSGLDDNGHGDPKSTEEMMQIQTFSGWDFGEIWKIGADGDSYPTLQGQELWTVEEEIITAHYQLNWDQIKGDNPGGYGAEVSEDLELPTEGALGTTISWNAEPESWINEETGALLDRPDPLEGSQSVILTATISKAGGTSREKEFNLTLSVYDPVADSDIAAAIEALTWDSIKGENGAADAVTADLANPLPIEGTNETWISWDVEPEGWVDPITGEITRPYSDEGDEQVTLTATVSKQYGVPQTKSFLLTVKANDFYWRGEGSELDPYQVESSSHLNDVRVKMLENEGEVYFKQTAHITLSSWNNWEPISAADEWGGLIAFAGTYDGDDYTISGLKIDDDSLGALGLFAYVGEQGILENIRLENVNINTSVSGAEAGGLADYNEGTVRNCSSSGSVTGSEESYVSGLVAYNSGIIENSYSTCEVSGGADSYAGGLLGYNVGTVKNCYSAGSVSAGAISDVGGLMGINDMGEITNCYYDSDTSGQSDDDGRGEPKTTGEMKLQATFAGWDFEDIWEIAEGLSYPRLIIERLPPAENNNGNTGPRRSGTLKAAIPKSVETLISRETLGMTAEGMPGAYTVSTPIASITFSQAALTSIFGENAGNVKVTVSTIENSTLTDEAQQLIGGRPVCRFSVTSGDQIISELGGNVTVSVPYTPLSGEDTDAIVIYYINAAGDLEVVADCAYDPATGTVSFHTDHFSDYAVGYNNVSFDDVAANAWYGRAVGFIAARGIVEGTGNGNYSPSAKLTRAEFLAMVLRAYGIEADENRTDQGNRPDNFSDAGRSWYTGYLSAAKRLEISSGVGNNKFAPDKEITRQEMVTLLYNTLKVINRLPEDTAEQPLPAFSDEDKVALWAKDAMTLLVKAEVISGSKGKLSPVRTATRAEMAQVLYNLLSK